MGNRTPGFQTFKARQAARGGEGAAVELVALGEGDAVLGLVQEVFAALGKADGLVPNGQVFESLVGHGLGISDLRFQIFRGGVLFLGRGLALRSS